MSYFSTSLTLRFCIIKHQIGVNERAIKEEALLTEQDNANSVLSERFHQPNTWKNPSSNSLVANYICYALGHLCVI